MESKKLLAVKRQKRILPGVILSGAVGFMFFLYAPLELYFSNKKEFWFDFYTVAPILFVAFLAVTVLGSVLFFVFALIHPRLYQAVLTAGFVAYVASYIQGNYLVKHLPPLDGTNVDWSMYGPERIKCVAVWVVAVVATAALIRFLKMERFYSVVKLVCPCVSLMMAVALVSVCIGNNGLEHKKMMQITDDGLYEMSDDTNFVVFLLDAVDARYFTKLLEENSKYQDVFQDFTYYPDTVGAYPFTQMSIPFLFSGEWFENKEPFEDYQVRVYKDAPFFHTMEGEGYRMGMYEPELPFQDESIYRFENIREGTSGITSYLNFLKAQFQLVGFKYAPFDLKRFCMLDTNYFKTLQKAEEGQSIFNYENLDFYHNTLETAVTHTKEKCFKFIHLEGGHVPFRYDENVELVEEGTYQDNLKASITLTAAWLEKLKSEGVYDNSVIIIMSDHGYAADIIEDGNLERQNPILLVKGLKERHSMEWNNAPISFADLQEAYVRLLEGKTGDEVFDAKEGQERERRYLFYVYLKENHIKEYFQTGKAWDVTTLLPSGEEYVR